LAGVRFNNTCPTGAGVLINIACALFVWAAIALYDFMSELKDQYCSEQLSFLEQLRPILDKMKKVFCDGIKNLEDRRSDRYDFLCSNDSIEIWRQLEDHNKELIKVLHKISLEQRVYVIFDEFNGFCNYFRRWYWKYVACTKDSKCKTNILGSKFLSIEKVPFEKHTLNDIVEENKDNKEMQETLELNNEPYQPPESAMSREDYSIIYYEPNNRKIYNESVVERRVIRCNLLEQYAIVLNSLDNINTLNYIL